MNVIRILHCESIFPLDSCSPSLKAPALEVVDDEVLSAGQRPVVEGGSVLGPALAEAAVQPQPEAALAAADDERVRAGAHDVAVLPRPLVHLHTAHSCR